MKSKLYLRIVLLSNYMMEENLFVYVECSYVKHAASRFSVSVTPGWTDISVPGQISFSSRSSMY